MFFVCAQRLCSTLQELLNLHISYMLGLVQVKFLWKSILIIPMIQVYL